MQPTSLKMIKGHKTRIFFAISVSIFIYSAYFYHLVRQQFHLLFQKQSALESIKTIAVPGTSFLNTLGSIDIFKSSLFYLVLLGMMFLVFMLLSLIFNAPLKRAFFLTAGLLSLIALTFHDRVNISFPFITGVSFVSFIS